MEPGAGVTLPSEQCASASAAKLLHRLGARSMSAVITKGFSIPLFLFSLTSSFLNCNYKQ